MAEVSHARRNMFGNDSGATMAQVFTRGDRASDATVPRNQSGFGGMAGDAYGEQGTFKISEKKDRTQASLRHDSNIDHQNRQFFKELSPSLRSRLPQAYYLHNSYDRPDQVQAQPMESAPGADRRRQSLGRERESPAGSSAGKRSTPFATLNDLEDSRAYAAQSGSSRAPAARAPWEVVTEDPMARAGPRRRDSGSSSNFAEASMAAGSTTGGYAAEEYSGMAAAGLGSVPSPAVQRRDSFSSVSSASTRREPGFPWENAQDPAAAAAITRRPASQAPWDNENNHDSVRTTGRRRMAPPSGQYAPSSAGQGGLVAPWDTQNEQVVSRKAGIPTGSASGRKAPWEE